MAIGIFGTTEAGRNGTEIFYGILNLQWKSVSCSGEVTNAYSRNSVVYTNIRGHGHHIQRKIAAVRE